MTAAVAQAQDPVAARRELMKALGAQEYGVLSRMVRGQRPYNQAEVDAAYKSLADNAGKIASVFPPESNKGPDPASNYYASPKIWESKADFDTKIANLAKAIAENKDKVKDLETLKAVFPLVNNQCGACHDAYQLRKS